MSPRKGTGSKRKGRSRLVAGIVITCLIAVGAYMLKDRARQWFAYACDCFTYKPRADAALVNQAIDSVYAILEPRRVSASTAEVGDHQVRCDRLELERDSSMMRANHHLTRAVERAGGDVVFGIESTDQKRRWQTVTLSISDGDSIIRQIALEKRIR
jgi:hypothetical protein